MPSVDAEADRQLQREWEACKADRNRIRTRLSSLPATQGVRVRLTRHFLEYLALVRVWDGHPLPAALVARLTREWTQYQHVEARRRELLQARRARVEDATDTVATQVQHLTRLRGIGPNGALTLSTELFAWGHFTNARQIGACVGLTPTPQPGRESCSEPWRQNGRLTCCRCTSTLRKTIIGTFSRSICSRDSATRR